MGKLAKLAALKTSSLEHFVFLPPDASMHAARIMVLVNLGYALGSPAAINWGTLSAVLRGLRRASPRARIMIVDKVCPAQTADAIFARIGLMDAIDEEMRVVPTDVLLKREYTNPLEHPIYDATFTAPEALADFDCVVNVAVFDGKSKPVRGSVNALYHLLPCDARVPSADAPNRYHDIYHTFAPHIDAVVMEVMVAKDDIRVITGDDLLTVDEYACRLTNAPIADYIEALRNS